MSPAGHPGGTPPASPLRRAAAVGLVLLAGGCSLLGGDRRPENTLPVEVPQASAVERPVVAELDDPVAPGEVRPAPGPFEDRIAYEGLAYVPGERPEVRGGIDNVQDVSTLLLLELAADFYDAEGRHVGTGLGQLTVREWQAAGGGFIPFVLRPEEPVPDAVGATITVVQLVND